MSDTLEIGGTKLLKVEGRDPFTDEAISEDSAGAIIAIGPVVDGQPVTVTGVSAGTATITVAPGSEDGSRTAGSDTITVTAPVDTSPLNVTLA